MPKLATTWASRPRTSRPTMATQNPSPSITLPRHHGHYHPSETRQIIGWVTAAPCGWQRTHWATWDLAERQASTEYLSHTTDTPRISHAVAESAACTLETPAGLFAQEAAVLSMPMQIFGSRPRETSTCIYSLHVVRRSPSFDRCT